MMKLNDREKGSRGAGEHFRPYSLTPLLPYLNLFKNKKTQRHDW